MSIFNWLGGDLTLISSWTQPDPKNPAVPGPTDGIFFNLGGTVTGAISVANATFTGATITMQGAIAASSNITFSFVAGSTASDITLEAGGSFTAPSELLGGNAVATFTQTGGSFVATGTANTLGIDTGSSFDLQDGNVTVAGFLALGNVSLTHGTGSFTQADGTVTAHGLVDQLGSYELDGGTLAVDTGNEFVGDNFGLAAEFTQKGGIHTVNGSIAIGQNGTGTFMLEGGEMSSIAEFIGQNSPGGFTQTGGTHTVSDRIVLGINLIGTTAINGTGTYTLGGTGSLSVNTLFIGSDPNCTGIFNFNTAALDVATLTIAGTEPGLPGLIVGGEGTGTFEHGSGDISTTLVVGRKVTAHGTYDLLSGSLTSTAEAIGGVGNGVFNQADGTNTANGTGLVIGSAATANGSYNLNGGTVEALSATVGDAGTGNFTQTAGDTTIFGALIVGNTGIGTWKLDGDGTLAAQDSVTLGAQAGAHGTFDFNAGGGGIATFTMLDPLTETVQTLTIGGAGTGMFVHAAGDLDAVIDVGAQAGGSGTYQLKAGNLTAPSETIGDAGAGTFTHTGGANTVNGALIVGNNNAGANTYTLGGTGNLVGNGAVTVGKLAASVGTFTFNIAAGDTATFTMPGQVLTIGDAGNGTFQHGNLAANPNGGDLNATLVLGAQAGGNGTYMLDAGAGSLTAPSETIGDAGVGAFTHTSGNNTVNGALIVGNNSAGANSYTLGGTGKLVVNGAVTVGALAASVGTFNFNTAAPDKATLTMAGQVLTIGDTGNGTFQHGNLAANPNGGDLNAKLVLGAQAGGNGTYILDAGVGSLTAPTETIGDAGVGAFTHTSGKNTVNGALIVGNNSAGPNIYTLGGTGNLLVNGAVTVGALAGSVGSFSFNTAAADLAIFAMPGQVLTIGDAGTGTFTHGNLAANPNGGVLNATLVLGAKAGGAGTYILDAGIGSLKAPSETIGDQGKGTFTHTSSSNTVNGPLIVGNNSAGPNSYTLGGTGNLTVNGAVTVGNLAGSVGSFAFNTAAADAALFTMPGQVLTIGAAGTGTFQHGILAANPNGGNLAATLVLGSQAGSNGTYILDAGAGTLTAPDETIGDAGTGTFTHTSGGNTVTTSGVVLGNSSGGNGTYTLGGTGQLTIQGGDLIIAADANASGTFNYNIAAADAATLTIPSGVIQVGLNGTGKFIQGAGSLVAKVIVGSQLGAKGNYELAGGSLSSLGQIVGNNGTGTFQQDSGTNAIVGGGDLILGSFSLGLGTYKLNSGQLTASNEILGNDGVGSFIQKGGNNLVNGGTTAILALGSQFDGGGAYQLTAGALIVGTGTTAGQEIVGNSGKGDFIQKGGSNTITGGNANLLVGELVNSTGTYELDAGTLMSGGQTIGDSGHGSFTQKGGTNTITEGSLLIGVHNTGSYNISGGDLIVQASTLPAHGDIVLGGSFSGPDAIGTMAAGTGGQITVGNDFVVWQGSTVSVLDTKSGIDIGISGSAQAGDILVEPNNELFGDGVINADVVDQGTIIATNNGTFSASNGGTLEINGTVSGNGGLTLAAGAALRLDDTVDPGNSVQFNDGAPERLILVNPGSGFANSVANLNASDSIEFGNAMTITAASLIDTGTVEVDFHGSGGFPGTYDLTNVNFGSSSPTTFVTGHDAVTGLDFIAVTCFVAGTRIATERGEVAVEKLREGDRVSVAPRGAQPIVWIGKRYVDCTRHARPATVWPVRISSGAFAPGRPCRDLYLSPDHAIHVMDVLIPVKYLVNGTSIVQVPRDEVVYYHIELPKHDLLLAERLAVESYLDTGDRANFANGGGPVALYPDFATRAWEANGCAPLVVTGPRLEAARRRVNALARCRDIKGRRSGNAAPAAA